MKLGQNIKYLEKPESQNMEKHHFSYGKCSKCLRSLCKENVL